jgi:hypothetical protein
MPSTNTGLAKNPQLFLRDLKLSQAAVRTDKYLRKNPNDRVLKALQSRKMNSNLASELAFLTWTACSAFPVYRHLRCPSFPRSTIA